MKSPNLAQSKNLAQTLELVGLAAILLSLIFVVLELRLSNVQARAGAFQALGIATAEWHQAFDDRMNRLFDQGGDVELLKQWTYSDWLAVERMLRSDLRLLETALLQVDEGLLDESALAQLGFSYFENWLSIPAVACIWPRISEGFGRVGPLVISRMETGTPPDQRATCPVDLGALRKESYGGLQREAEE
jgi:hypothetical protein